MATYRRIISKFPRHIFRSAPYHSGGVKKQIVTDHPAEHSSNSSINFEEHYSEIFKAKSNWEILRALLVINVCKYDSFVHNSVQFYQKSRRLFGKQLVDYVTDKTFYRQFCGGTGQEELGAVAKRLDAAGIGTQLAAVIEDPVDSSKANSSFYDQNLEKLLNTANLISQIDKRNPRFQLRITALLPGSLLSKMTTHLKNHGQDCLPVEEIAETLITGKKREYQLLTTGENQVLHEGLMRCRVMTRKLLDAKVRTQVDAEYTTMNPAFSVIVMAMALVCNQKTPLVWNTFQCYLKQAMHDLEQQIQFAEKHQISFGAKVVRGAYILSETARATKLGVENPVCDSYEVTSENYDKVVHKLLGLVADRYPHYHMIIASHNENSILKAIERMNQLSLPPSLENVVFGQLYGMCDQISYPLGQRGYNVCKSVPVGNLEESLPYLSRRATENKSVLAGVRKELTVLTKVLRGRMMLNF